MADSDEPFLLIEAKLMQDCPSPVLKRFQNLLHVPAVQLVEESDGFRILSNETHKILIAPAHQWLSRLP